MDIFALYLLSILISDPELLEVITDLQGFEGRETDDPCEADQPGEIEPGLKTGKQKKIGSCRIVLDQLLVYRFSRFNGRINMWEPVK